MTTKEQERKALEQIRKIVAGLGENSYIATAFEGCFEIAEQNIDNDFACSMKQRWEKAEADSEYFNDVANHEAAEVQRLEKKIEQLKKELATANDQFCGLKKMADQFNMDYLDAVREVKIETEDGERDFHGRFAKIRYTDSKGFRFFTVEQENGWVDSYKFDDLKTFEIH